MKAFCWASGLIEFHTRRKPRAEILAESDDAQALRDFIGGRARHGYKTVMVDGRPTKIDGSDCLLVPGIPEAKDQAEAYMALVRFRTWLRKRPPAGIVVP